MFTPHSRKAVLSITALTVAVTLAAAMVFALDRLSVWAEQELHAYPFKSEDWLRYLLPASRDRARPQIMLAGASTVRENFRVELFEEKFPSYDLYQGGISSGTLPDVLAGLEYIERVHGAEALPEVIVLGISLRIVANLPESRSFARGVNLYSPYFSAIERPRDVVLVPKTIGEGLAARLRFLVRKQPARFRTTVVAMLAHWLSRQPADGRLARALEETLASRPAVGLAKRLGINTSKAGLLEASRFLISPYKYTFQEHISDETYGVATGAVYDPKADTTWGPIYTWDGHSGEAVARHTLRRFAEYVKARRIPTLVVNMPERSFSRRLYVPGSYEKYLEIVQQELEDIPLVDLRTFLETPEFFDREHTTTAGSMRLTAEVIRLTRHAMAQRPSIQSLYAHSPVSEK